MSRITQIKTNFTAGEIAPDLLGRGDLRAYDNGALALRNVFIFPTGGITRRSGTAYITTLPGDGRMITYEYSADLAFLLVFTHLAVHVYQDGVFIQTLTTPWTLAQLDQLSWAQSASELLLVHPDVKPQKIVRSALGGWSISDWTWAKDTTGNTQYMPYYRFAAPDVTLYSTGTTGSVTITASSPIFTSSYIGVCLRIRSTECVVTGYTNSTTVTATVSGTLAANPATTDWSEAALSSLRGYPISVAFHQDRLVIGGSKSLPNRLWLSKTGNAYNFDLGTGLDDEAIEFGILSDQINTIRAIVSGRHLQIFTSSAEWMVTGNPLTPTNVQVLRQTRVGSVVERTIPPVDVDGATLFVARHGDQIREFLYTDVEAAYQATDLALLSRSVIAGTIGQAYDKVRRLLFVVRDDGKFATLTMFRPEQVAAWTLHETDGVVKGICVVGNHVYAHMLRGSDHILEEIDDTMLVDAGLAMDNPAPLLIWSGLDHLNGKTVNIIGDGVVQASKVVSGGSVTLDTAATHVQIGLGFTHKILPLPPNINTLPAILHKMRLVRMRLRLQNTDHIEMDVGRGMRTIPLPHSSYTGDVVISGYGWHSMPDLSLWSIESDVPAPFTLLSIATEMKVN